MPVLFGEHPETMRLQFIQIVYYFATEECDSIFKCWFVNDHGSAFCLNTLHDALDAGVTLTQSQNRDSLLKYYKMEIFLSKIDVKELDK